MKKRLFTALCCFILICAQIPLISFAETYTTRIEADTIFQDGDEYASSYLGRNGNTITIQVNGTLTLKKKITVYGDVTIIGLGDDAKIVYGDTLEYNERSGAIIVGANNATKLTLKNIEVVGSTTAPGPVINVYQSNTNGVGSLIVGENTTINAGDSSRKAILMYGEDSNMAQYENHITIDSTANIIGTVPEGVTYTGGESTEPTLSAALEASTDSVQVDDTVSVTASLNPSEAMDLSTASLTMTYDADTFSVHELELSDVLKNRKDVRITYDVPGQVTVSFVTTDEESPLNVSGDGVDLFTASFVANAVSEASAFAVTGVEGAVPDATKELAVEENYPSVSVAVTEKVVEATVANFGSDYKILMYGTEQAPAEGNAFFLNGQQMTYVPAYSAVEGFEGKQVYVLLATEVPETLIPTEEAAASALSINPASGDANMNGRTNIVDAQVAYYMLAGKVDSTTEGLDWLNTDVNGDGVITALDYQAIQYFVHYGEFGQFN